MVKKFKHVLQNFECVAKLLLPEHGYKWATMLNQEMGPQGDFYAVQKSQLREKVHLYSTPHKQAFVIYW